MQGKIWCVVKPGAPDFKLQTYIIAKCVEVDCKEVQPGGSCFEPNTLQNHASYVLNLYFRGHGDCDSDIGLVSVDDPCKSFLLKYVYYIILSYFII